MKKIIGTAILATCATSQATSILTDFGGVFNPDFEAGNANVVDVSGGPVTIGSGFTATFSDGLAIQGSGNGGLYNNFFGLNDPRNTGNNAAFFVLNNGRDGAVFSSIPNNADSFVDTIDVASVIFSGAVSNVSFAFQILGNGAASAVDLLALDGSVLGSVSLIEDDPDRNSIASFSDVSIDTASFGEVFGVQFNNSGPAQPVANPPYGIVVDTFSATAIPEPSTALLAGLALGLPFLRRRR